MQLEHGGNLERAIQTYGGSRSDWIDISTGISPFIAPIPDLDLSSWHRLPERAVVSELAEIAKKYYASKQNCLVTSGSQFLINHLPDLLQGDVGIVGPTYGEYAGAFARNNRSYTALSSIDDIGDVRSLVLANPNNPDGRLYSQDELCVLAKVLKQRDGYLVVDEAFCDVCEKASMLMTDPIENLIVLKSFGKFFGLAGARIGFVFAHNEVLSRIKYLQGPWSVSGPSISVARHVLTRDGIHCELLKKISSRHGQFIQMLGRTGLKIAGGTKLFTLIEHESAANLHEHLLVEKILTRKFDYNASWLRLGLTCNEEEDLRLQQAILSFEN
ncbi:MAG: threonine-phosphate decarboxylase CobD [Lentilitoribacter sp.]